MRLIVALLVFLLMMLMNACAALQEEEDKNQKIADTNLRLGMGYMRQGKLEDALEKLKKAENAKPDYGDVHTALGMLYEQLLKPDEAEDHYREAIDLKPEDGGVFNNYGVYLCRHGRFKDADVYFQKAIDTPRYKTPELALENAGACAKKIPDLEKSEIYLRRALSINAKLPLALAEMADLMYLKDNYMSTRAYLQRYEEVSKHTAQSLWLGIRNERKLGDNSAEAHYAKLLQTQYPDSVEFKRWLEETP